MMDQVLNATASWLTNVGFETDRFGLEKSAKEWYEYGVIVFVRPNHPGHVLVSCLSFFLLMITICWLVERTNPDRNVEGRGKQVRAEIMESIPAVFASTSASIIHLNYIYPLRWGIDAPIFPVSFVGFVVEVVYWMSCFEVFVYFLHRFLHMRRPIDIYKHIHRDHHLFFFPSAFASQAIHPLEAILFAETSLIASVFIMPISVVTQYLCGIMLLVWSIFAHDSRFMLDKGAHYEHHSHPQTNFGFMGFMDLLFDTIHWGSAYDDPSKLPPYVERWRWLHEVVFGKDPLMETHLEESNDEQVKALAERRRRIMTEKKLS